MSIRYGFAFFAAALFFAPVGIAQSVEGEKEGASPLDGLSDEQLQAEFRRLSTDVSKGMGVLEGELAKASLPARSVEELKAELETHLERMKTTKGRTGVHDGLHTWLVEDAERLAKLLGVTTEEAEKLVKDSKGSVEGLLELVTKMSGRTTEIAKALEDSASLRRVLDLQIKAEEKLTELVKQQEERAKAVGEQLEKMLELAYEMRDRAPP